MLNNINYIRLKSLLLKYYKNSNVFVNLKGIIDTQIIIKKARITINKHKLIISNEEKDFSIEFMMMKKIKLKEKFHIELEYADFTTTLEI